MTARLFMINRYKGYFTYKWRQIFVTSLVLSLVEYCLPIWGNISETKCEQINSIMLKAAKLVIMNNMYVKLPKIDIFDKMNWLNFQERVNVYTLDFVFKYVKCKSSLNTCLTKFVNRESTRASKLEHDFLVPKMKKEYGKTAFFYRGIMLWNSLPSDIKSSPTYGMFYNSIRKHILLQRK